MEQNIKTIIHTLNEFLQGQYMGIRSYENHIEKMEDPGVKRVFEEITNDHRHHAEMVKQRIYELGGTPVDDQNVMGKFQVFMSQFRIPDTTEGMIENALKGEDTYGIGSSEKIVRGDLDEKSYELIQQILNKDREHVEKLNRLLH